MLDTYKVPRISIAACRVNAKLNQRKFAEKVGVSLATVTNWELGRTISELSGIPMDFIFVDRES